MLEEPESALARLWRRLKQLDGVGWATAGKLCARKRPKLAPVYDDVVLRAARKPTSWWCIVAALFADEALRTRLQHLRGGLAPEDQPTLLRTLDIVVWMRQHGYRWAADPGLRALEPSSDDEPQ